MAKKLFEVLVIEGQLKSQAQVTRNDLKATFEKKRHLFEEKLKTFQPIEEGAQVQTEEESNIQSTVMSELRWLGNIWMKALDTSYQVAEGNTKARADVVLDDGTVLLENAPATALLELEKRAAEIQEVIASVPTFDPAKGFHPDPDKGKYVYRAREVRKTRTKKVPEVITLAQATPEHPAQAQLVNIDKIAGHITEQEWSGFIMPAHKAQMLERVEELRRSIKAALHRANAVELDTNPKVCGQKIFEYVIKDYIPEKS